MASVQFKIPVKEGMSDIRTPAFIIRKQVVEKNCEDIRNKGYPLRAHTKTHKTIEGVDLQTNGSRRGLVCSTLAECEFYAENGCNDILFGIPLGRQHIDAIFSLVKKVDIFHVMIDSAAAVDLLVSVAPPEGKKWSVFMAIDLGYGREGIEWNDTETITRVAKALTQNSCTTLMGLYTHCGGSYDAAPGKVFEALCGYTKQMGEVSRALKSSNIHCQVVGIGSSPSCLSMPPQGPNGDDKHKQHVVDEEINEIHPGNFIFCDLEQTSVDVCGRDRIACSVATKVVSIYPSKNTFIIDCGFTALTKQGEGKINPGFGAIENHDNLMLNSMSQEHGIVTSIDGSSIDFSKFPIGSILHILPWHSCATADKFQEFHVADSEGVVTEIWRPVRGW